MLFVLDVGNTNTVLGSLREVAKSAAVRVTTSWWPTGASRLSPRTTVDEYGVSSATCFRWKPGIESDYTESVMSSVVPPLDSTLRQSMRTILHQASVHRTRSKDWNAGALRQSSRGWR